MVRQNGTSRLAVLLRRYDDPVESKKLNGQESQEVIALIENPEYNGTCRFCYGKAIYDLGLCSRHIRMAYPEAVNVSSDIS